MDGNFGFLSSAWMYWNNLAQIPNPSVSTDCSDCLITFGSEAQIFHLRREDDWWVVDVVDDRGKRYNDTSRFSELSLVEKYLVWDWASFARSAVGLEALGPPLYRQGPNPKLKITPTDNQWRSEITSQEGKAILSEPELTIFSHILSKPLREIEEMVRSGFE